MTELLKLLDHESLSSTVYTAMCTAIREGKFKPGDRIKIRDISKQFGTSVTPVRDAIIRLAHDEAVEFRSARDIRIPNLTKARYLEIRTIRLRLEGLVAETAARFAEPADVKVLEQIIGDNEIAIKDGDNALGSELNQRFHFYLVEIARMPILRGMLQRIWLQMGPIISDTYLEGGRLMIEHHYPIVKALRDRDPEAAAAGIMNDILLGGRVIADRLSVEAA